MRMQPSANTTSASSCVEKPAGSSGLLNTMRSAQARLGRTLTCGTARPAAQTRAA